MLRLLLIAILLILLALLLINVMIRLGFVGGFRKHHRAGVEMVWGAEFGKGCGWAGRKEGEELAVASIDGGAGEEASSEKGLQKQTQSSGRASPGRGRPGRQHLPAGRLPTGTREHSPKRTASWRVSARRRRLARRRPS
jgi:hypothetical protein